MDDGDRSPSTLPRASSAAGPIRLPFLVEIWNLPRAKVERVIARAESMAVARALFRTAVSESPSRRIILRQGARVIADHG